jgi:hypothetical protein
MALTETQEAKAILLTDQQPELSNLADNEAAIISRMATPMVTLEGLPEAGAINDADLLLIRQSGTDKKVTAANLVAGANAAYDPEATYPDGSIGDAIGGKADKSSMPVNVLDYASAGTDTAMLNAAIAVAAAYVEGGVVYMPANRVYSIANVTVPANVVIDAGRANIRAPASTSTLFRITGGRSGIRGGIFTDPSNLATRAIVIAKAQDDTPCIIEGAEFSEFTNAIEVSSGDCIKILNNRGVSNGLFLLVTNGFLNSAFNGNYVLGGNGVSVQKTTQGAEGCEFNDNWILPATGGTYCMNFQCGLHMDIRGNVLDQVITGNGISLDGTINPLAAFTIQDNWVGRQAAATGANYGIYAYGNIDELDIVGNTFAGFRQANIYLNGSSPDVLNRVRVMNNNHHYGDPAVRDLELAYVGGIEVFGEKFAGAASLVEGVSVIGRVDACDWAASVAPSAGVSQNLRYGQQVRGLVLSGTYSATIPSGATTVSVAHGLAYQPAAANFSVTGANNPTNDPGNVWVDGLTSTNFAVNCRSNPGTSGAVFGVKLDMTR